MKYSLFLYQKWFSQNLGKKARNILFMPTKMQIQVGLKKLKISKKHNIFTFIQLVLDDPTISRFEDFLLQE